MFPELLPYLKIPAPKQYNWGKIAFLATCAGAIGHSQVKKKQKQETNKTQKSLDLSVLSYKEIN